MDSLTKNNKKYHLLLALCLHLFVIFPKLFFCHDTITVVVVCTIATAKVQRNYNCYNVYFNECLPSKYERRSIKIKLTACSSRTSRQTLLIFKTAGYCPSRISPTQIIFITSMYYFCYQKPSNSSRGRAIPGPVAFCSLRGSDASNRCCVTFNFTTCISGFLYVFFIFACFIVKHELS